MTGLAHLERRPVRPELRHGAKRAHIHKGGGEARAIVDGRAQRVIEAEVVQRQRQIRRSDEMRIEWRICVWSDKSM